jgi:Methyltransferase domain
MQKGSLFRHRLSVLHRLISGRSYRLLGKLNILIQPKQYFSIKPGYHFGKNAEVFDDRENKDEWQQTVYELALLRLKEIRGNSLIDVGCGSAYKLINMLGDYDTLGIELRETYYWLLEKYPSKKWMAFENTDPSKLQCDVVICSDVIEHVRNPDIIMDFLKSINFRCLVLSTPERDSVRGAADFGPPENTSHYREWNKQEFNEYVSNWFRVEEQIISHDKSPSQILFCIPLTGQLQ